MHHSPLIIDYYFIKKIHFELKAGFDTNFEQEVSVIEPPKLKINVDGGQHSDERLHWRFELSIDADEKASKKEFPYTFSITVVGYFRVDENFPAENADMLAKVNAPSVLYSAAREFLAIVTGRSPHPAILLPSVSFLPLPEAPKKEEKKISPQSKDSKKVRKVPAKNSVKK